MPTNPFEEKVEEKKGAYLMVIDSGGSVVPGKHSALRGPSSESDEIFGLGDVHRLPVDSRRDPNHRPANVAKRHGVDRLLHRLEISGSVLWNGDYARCHSVERKEKFWLFFFFLWAREILVTENVPKVCYNISKKKME